MNRYPFDRNLHNIPELLDYFIDAIHYRNKHKDQSSAIALHVFDATHPALKLSFSVDEDIELLRYGFGALEAPGMPEDDNQDPDEYDDEVWALLLARVWKVKKNRRTV